VQLIGAIVAMQSASHDQHYAISGIAAHPCKKRKDGAPAFRYGKTKNGAWKGRVTRPFSPGLVLSHEIDHKFPAYNPNDNGPGGVIDYVNGIQRQLGLPTRDMSSHTGTCSKGTCSIPFHDQNGQQHLLKWQLENKR